MKEYRGVPTILYFESAQFLTIRLCESVSSYFLRLRNVSGTVDFSFKTVLEQQTHVWTKRVSSYFFWRDSLKNIPPSVFF
ncbi:hypothetical protein DLM75_23055 [Leptospira stimsonii]|uniref:Uncharacterized protein n=1 Tax=Leptospira stimsonii TaxID=2202203 RepID=A0A396YNC2_9LEPT|nr:hypothetical protein DLM75_23055 [Leptospira stimsonii]